MFRRLSVKLENISCVPELSGTHVFLSLGSNLGDRKAYLKKAFSLLGEGGFSLEKVSSLYETSPEGCEEGAKKFLNLVSSGFWKKDAHALLALCKQAETALGRPPDHPHWVSRVADIDILLFGEEKLFSETLTVPHPLALQRRFVLEPLAEIAPDLIFPGTGKSCGELLRELTQA